MTDTTHLPDRDLLHLWPPFRAKVETLLERMHARTGVPWMMEEGHRSDGRQGYLWSIGRRGIPGERPVTWIRDTPWHGAGLAADLRPVAGYACPHEWWDILFEEEAKLGLIDPPRKMGDLGHVQLACDEATREEAKRWTLAGFPQDTPAPPAPDRLAIDGAPAAVRMVVENGEHYVNLRDLGGNRGWQIGWDEASRTVAVRTKP